MNKKVVAIGGAVIAVILLSALGFYYFYLYKPQISAETLRNQEVKLAELSKQANADLRNLDYEEGIQKSWEVSRAYQSLGEKEKAAIATIKSGFLYNKSGDYKIGIPILKTVAFDKSLPPKIRSEAMIKLGIAAFGDGGRGALETIFKGENYPAIKRALVGGDPERLYVLRRALTNLFSISREIYDYGYASYAVAAAKSATLSSRYKEYSPAERDRRKQEIVALVESGDLLTLEESKSPDFIRGNFIYDFFLAAKNQKLKAFVQLARVDRAFEDKAKKQYDESIGAFNLLDNASARGTESYARFYYASMLADLYGGAKKQEISDVIAPTMSGEGDWGKANESVIWPFYEMQLTRPAEERGVNEKYILKIASVDPAFDKFLKDKGWKK